MKKNVVRIRPSRRGLVLIGIIVLILAVHVFLDRWFGYKTHAALGYGAVYAKNMWFELLTRYGGAVVYAVFGVLAARPLARVMPEPAAKAVRLLAGVLGWLIGYAMWSLVPTDWYLFFSHASFHRVDPLFHMDLSFYVYQLPVLVGLVGRIIGTLALFAAVRVLVVVAAFLRQQTALTKKDFGKTVQQQARAVFWLIAVILLFSTVDAILLRYQLALAPGDNSFLYGPGFVAAHLTIPIFSWVHIAALFVFALSLIYAAIRTDKILPIQDGFVNISVRAFKRPLQFAGLYVGLAIVTGITGALVNALYVHPNQNSVELPYIRNSIDATRYALGLQHVASKPFTPKAQLTQAGVKKDQNALANVRVNDQNQTTQIYNQLQSFKSYFVFPSASVDRYNQSEVYVSARQMDVSKIPVKTWINQTLVYTHGYGLAISPVNQFDSDGLPTMWAKNTPQETQAPLPSIKQPDIYFGKVSNDVIAPSKEAEFDYPVGSTDHTSHYKGGYGLPIQGNRLLLAIETGTLKYFTSDQITSKSEWLFDRNIYTRVKAIAPFLTYDKDAFPFIDANGQIEWMLDAYTETSRIPYAQPAMGTAYIRNSVKVVMNAYTGKVTYYVVDAKDPLLKSLMATYPSLFTTHIPADIRAHFRYPKDLFTAQANALTRYHMTNPSAFYNQEDLWAMAKQIYQQNQATSRPPVYQMIRMPDQDKPQFVLSALFTPANKDNLNGWLVADNEPDHYGQLTLYHFPDSSLIFGPMQAENQIDSDPNVSSQLTLWNQQGSHVIRGDLLMIPVGDTLLYVEPIYLVANRQNSLPQLERVIIDFNKQVYMGTSLGDAISSLLQGTTAATPTPNTPQGGTSGGGQSNGAGGGTAGGTTSGSTGTQSGGAPSGSTGGTGQTGQGTANTQSLIKQADQLFQQYTQDTAKGDYTAAGTDLSNLGTVLSQLHQLSGQGSTQKGQSGTQKK